ncbi:peptide/nickel transport system ATP-binding protein [Nocardioides scoriae]|uniref:Peptide/nickel transport system ATP-binding protein n=1 Tax=Nocardioides scoriae TaxID=642780 RepID=A0A1H1V6U3_9ACTN|nr:ATP-binding cassette domain-containing protein [Nocardioides scoriae]SDS80425.1 peptide/nickel transport system ATP-binding protein [Nocardioides scoriae]
MSAGLRLDGVTHLHDRAGTAGVRDVSLAVAPGETVGLVGRSGAGKSTLVSVALGLLPAQRGEVAYDGRPLPRRRPGPRRSRELRRTVQWVPQDPAGSLDPRRHLGRQLLDPQRRLRVPGDHEQRAREALARVGLDATIATRRPHEVSGGQAQRVALARALVTGARVLLADEPVTGLDHDRRDDVLDLLLALSRDPVAPLGLLLVCHDLDAVARTCARTVVLDGGRVVEQGPTGPLLTRPTHPATRALVDARPPDVHPHAPTHQETS